ncbi:helix-turn-helix transcriptional regulator [Krasilnikovia sp. MM14-A1259]|uniref:helix-turn-helix transcriptional regulator n=1 Tax=Krasilnikovia sp. MM14-A1259 TaxID=3373539 RepID=UPI00382FD0CA
MVDALSSFVGRERELLVLSDAIMRATAGQGSALLVEGEPGIGKSSLARAAAAAAAAAGCRAFSAVCDELSQAFPLLPLLEAFEVDDAAADPGRRAVMRLLHGDATPGQQADVPAATAQVVALVEHACAASPALLIVDDLQWADPSTVTAWSRLARSTRRLPLVLIGTTRPVPHREDVVMLRRVVEPGALLRLGGLGHPESTRLVAGLVGGTPGEHLSRLAQDAAGNPLYLTELIGALRRGGRLVATGEGVEVTENGTPTSLSAAIADRLDFVAAPVRRLLRAAALLGVGFSVADLATVSGRRVADLVPALEEAVVAGVLRDQDGTLAFRHPLIRTALYESIPAAVRAAWHQEAARALAAHGGRVDRVARQMLAACDATEPDGRPVDDGPPDDWTVRWLTDNSRRLLDQAPQAAVPLLRRAVQGTPAGTPPHDTLAARLADALYRVGQADAAATVATCALGHVRSPDALVDLHWTLTQCRALQGRSAESLAVLEAALAAPVLTARHRARLLALTARTHRSLGHVDAADRAATTALAEATAANDRWATAWALAVSILVHGMRGEVQQALPLFQRALAATDGDPDLGDLRLVLQINYAAALGDLDRYSDAVVAAQRARLLADHLGNLLRRAQAHSVLAELLFDIGRWDEVLAELAPGPLTGDLSRDPVVECSDHGIAAAVHFHRGEPHAAGHLRDAQPYAARLGERVIGPFVLARSLDREVAGAPHAALAVLMDSLSDSPEELEETEDLLAAAVRLATTVGDRAAAADVTGRAELLAGHSPVPHHRATALHCRGLLDHDAGVLLRAADGYRGAGRPLLRAQALEAAGVAAADGGDLADGRRHFTEAYALYSGLRAAWDLARTQARFRTYGIRRGPRTPHRRALQGWDSLTPAETTVVALIARGMSNPQIAAQLFLSRRTVQTHVSHILAKLDLRSRTDVAREASLRTLAPLA